MKDYNPRAFARTQNGRAGAQKGMSLRDYFAGHALNGVLSRTNGWDDDEVISYAYNMANKMLEVRSEQED